MVKLVVSDGQVLDKEINTDVALLRRQFLELEQIMIKYSKNPEVLGMMCALQWLNMGVRYQIDGNSAEAKINLRSAELFLNKIK